MKKWHKKDGKAQKSSGMLRIFVCRLFSQIKEKNGLIFLAILINQFWAMLSSLCSGLVVYGFWDIVKIRMMFGTAHLQTTGLVSC